MDGELEKEKVANHGEIWISRASLENDDFLSLSPMGIRYRFGINFVLSSHLFRLKRGASITLLCSRNKKKRETANDCNYGLFAMGNSLLWWMGWNKVAFFSFDAPSSLLATTIIMILNGVNSKIKSAPSQPMVRQQKVAEWINYHVLCVRGFT